MKKPYKIITGEDILTVSPENREPLIEGLLYPKDYIMIAAEPKIGKTVITQQLTNCMTSGKPFLGVYNINKPLKVWYFATEGKEDDLKDRFCRINKSVPMVSDNLALIPTCFQFNTKEGVKYINEICTQLKDLPPDVIIIDAIYRAIGGKLTDESVINAFHQEMAVLQNEFNCAIILIHHLTKPQYDPVTGKKKQRQDLEAFGSIFLIAAVDHIILLDKWGKDPDCKKDRILKCDTQRSGEIAQDIRIRMVEPDPLYFEVVSQHEKEKHIVIELLKVNSNGLSMSDLIKKSSLGRSTLFVILKELENEEIITRDGNRKRDRIYRLDV